MGFRYRRSKKIAPGIRINASKSGPSVTIGGKYAKTTIGKGRVTNTYKTPIKGLSYSTTTRTSSSSKSKRRPSSKSTSSGKGCLGFFLGLCVLSLLISFSVVLIYLGIVALLLYFAYSHYKIHNTYTPDQYERFASLLYLDDPEGKHRPRKIYSDLKKAFKNYPQEISTLEYQARAYIGENVSDLCQLLDERDAKQWQYQSLLEIKSEPDFYEPVFDNFYGETFKLYIENTFQPVYNEAQKLLTKRGRNNRYVKYLDRFAPCYDYLPEVAKVEIDKFMEELDISFSVTTTPEEGGNE